MTAKKKNDTIGVSNKEYTMSYMLIDLNQVLISNLMQHLKIVSKSHEMNEDLIRHMCINTIRASVRQFKSKYPNVILCCDNRKYWRKDYFPFYKSQRKHEIGRAHV